MQQWQYRTIDLNDLPRKGGEIDLLNGLGEPVAAGDLKRQVEAPASSGTAAQGRAAASAGHRVITAPRRWSPAAWIALGLPSNCPDEAIDPTIVPVLVGVLGGSLCPRDHCWVLPYGRRPQAMRSPG
jgi:hypothetical protein